MPDPIKLYKELKEYKDVDGNVQDLIPKYKTEQEFTTALGDRNYRQKLHQYLSANELLPDGAESYVQFEKDVMGGIVSKPQAAVKEPTQSKPKGAAMPYSGEPLSDQGQKTKDLLNIESTEPTPIKPDPALPYEGPYSESYQKAKGVSEFDKEKAIAQQNTGKPLYAKSKKELETEYQDIIGMLENPETAYKESKYSLKTNKEYLKDLELKAAEYEDALVNLDNPDRYDILDPNSVLKSNVESGLIPQDAYTQAKTVSEFNKSALNNRYSELNDKIGKEVGLDNIDILGTFTQLSSLEESGEITKEQKELKDRIEANGQIPKLVQFKNKLDRQTLAIEAAYPADTNLEKAAREYQIAIDKIDKGGMVGPVAEIGRVIASTGVKVAESLNAMENTLQNLSISLTGKMINFGALPSVKASTYNALVDAGNTVGAAKFLLGTEEKEALGYKKLGIKYMQPSNRQIGPLAQIANKDGILYEIEDGQVTAVRDKDGYIIPEPSEKIIAQAREIEKDPEKFNPSRVNNLGIRSLATATQGAQIISDMAPILAMGAVSGGTGVTLGSFATMYGPLYEQGIKEFGSANKAALYATSLASIMSLIEVKLGKLGQNFGNAIQGRINRDAITADLRDVTVRFTNGELTPTQFSTEGIKAFIGRTVSELPGELKDEGLQLLTEEVGQSITGIKDFDISWQELGETGLLTIVATLPVGALTATISGNQFKAGLRTAIEKPALLQKELDGLVAEGVITQNQADETELFIQNIVDIGLEYQENGASKKTVQKIKDLNLDKAIEQKRADTAKTELVKTKAEKAVAAIDAKIKEIDATIGTKQEDTVTEEPITNTDQPSPEQDETDGGGVTPATVSPIAEEPIVSNTPIEEVPNEVLNDVPNEGVSEGVNDGVNEPKADIERRRQEELKNRVVWDRFPTVKDGEFKIVGDPNNRIYRINENTGRPQELDLSNGLWSNTALAPNLFMESTKRSGFEKSKDKINAKYDAELKALEQQPTSTTQSEIEAKKADIERRKQEELKDELDKKAKDIPVKKEYYKDTNGNDITVTTYRAGNKTFTFTKSNNVAADNFEDLDLESITPYKTENITSKLENKINAKYDAEIEALEKSPEIPKSEETNKPITAKAKSGSLYTRQSNGTWVSERGVVAKSPKLVESLNEQVKDLDSGYSPRDSQKPSEPKSQETGEVLETTTKTKETKQGYTEVRDLNRIYKEVKTKYGAKEGTKIIDTALRLVDTTKNEIVEIRSNGVVVKEEGKFLFKPFTNTDANSKKWTLGKPMDISEQFTTPTQEVKDKAVEVDFTAKNGNKVVDEKGEPITVYHTTTAENIKEFRTSGEIETLGGKVKNEGAYFTPNKGEYTNKGGKEYAVQISIKNPYITTDQTESAIISPEKKAELVSKGHDGVILMRNGKPAEYIVFDKSQIKSEQPTEAKKQEKRESSTEPKEEPKSKKQEEAEQRRNILADDTELQFSRADTKKDSPLYVDKSSQIKHTSSPMLVNQIAEAEKEGNRTKLISLRVIKALLPTFRAAGITLKLHPDSDSMMAAQRQANDFGDAAKGFYNPKTKEIHLNLESLTTDTPIHEILHPIVGMAMKAKPDVVKNWVESIKSDPIMGKDLAEFIERNYGKEKPDIKEAELVVTYVGQRVAEILSADPKNQETRGQDPEIKDGKKSLYKKLIQKVKDLLNDLGIGLYKKDIIGEIGNETSVSDLAYTIADIISRNGVIQFQSSQDGNISKSVDEPIQFNRDDKFKEWVERKVNQLFDNRPDMEGNEEYVNDSIEDIYEFLKEKGKELSKADKSLIAARMKEKFGIVDPKVRAAQKSSEATFNNQKAERVAEDLNIPLDNKYVKDNLKGHIQTAMEADLDPNEILNKVNQGNTSLSKDEYLTLVILHSDTKQSLTALEQRVQLGLATPQDLRLMEEFLNKMEEINNALVSARSTAGFILGSGSHILPLPKARTAQEIADLYNKAAGMAATEETRKLTQQLAEKLAKLEAEHKADIENADAKAKEYEQKLAELSARISTGEIKAKKVNISRVKDKKGLFEYVKTMSKSVILKSKEDGDTDSKADPDKVRREVLLGAIKVAIESGTDHKDITAITDAVNGLIEELNAELAKSQETRDQNINPTNNQEIIATLLPVKKDNIDNARTKINKAINELRTEAKRLNTLENLLNGIYKPQTGTKPNATQIKDIIDKIRLAAYKSETSENAKAEINELLSKVDANLIDWVNTGSMDAISRAIEAVRTVSARKGKGKMTEADKESAIAKDVKKWEDYKAAIDAYAKDSDKSASDILDLVATMDILPKKRESEYSKKLQARQSKLRKLRENLRRVAEAAHQKVNSSWLEKTGAKVDDVIFNFFRSLKVTGDISAIFTNAYLGNMKLLFEAFAERDVAKAKVIQKAFVDAWGAFKAGLSNREDVALAHYEALQGMNGDIYEHLYGLKLSHPFDPELSEEYFKSNFAAKMGQQMGKAKFNIIQASEAHMTTYLNTIRYSLFNTFYEANPSASKEELQNFAEIVNLLTGTTNKPVGAFMTRLFLAPKYMISRWKVLASTFYDKKDKTRAIQQAVGTALVLPMLIAAGAWLLSGDDEPLITFDFDPLSPHFLKTKIGDNYIQSIPALTNIVQLMMKMVLIGMDANDADLTDIQKSNAYLAGGKGSFSLLDPSWQYLKGRFNPAAGVVSTLITQRDFKGDPYAPGWQGKVDMTVDVFAPISVGSFFENMINPKDDPNFVERMQPLLEVMGVPIVNYQNASMHKDVQKIFVEADWSIGSKAKTPESSWTYPQEYFKDAYKNELQHRMGLAVLALKREDPERTFTYKQLDKILEDVKGNRVDYALPEDRQMSIDKYLREKFIREYGEEKLNKFVGGAKKNKESAEAKKKANRSQ
jgi:hypothetical protein